MEMVLRGLTWKTCLVYLDDIMVIGKTFEEHLTNLEEVFSLMKEANLKFNSKKCLLFQKEVEFLRHTVSANGIKTTKTKINAIRNWPRPRDKQEVCSFLGLCTYYRRFVNGFADIAAPMHRLTDLKSQFNWTAECEEAFKKLKIALCPIRNHRGSSSGHGRK